MFSKRLALLVFFPTFALATHDGFLLEPFHVKCELTLDVLANPTNEGNRSRLRAALKDIFPMKTALSEPHWLDALPKYEQVRRAQFTLPREGRDLVFTQPVVTRGKITKQATVALKGRSGSRISIPLYDDFEGSTLGVTRHLVVDDAILVDPKRPDLILVSFSEYDTTQDVIQTKILHVLRVVEEEGLEFTGQVATLERPEEILYRLRTPRDTASEIETFQVAYRRSDGNALLFRHFDTTALHFSREFSVDWKVGEGETTASIPEWLKIGLYFHDEEDTRGEFTEIDIVQLRSEDQRAQFVTADLSTMGTLLYQFGPETTPDRGE